MQSLEIIVQHSHPHHLFLFVHLHTITISPILRHTAPLPPKFLRNFGTCIDIFYVKNVIKQHICLNTSNEAVTNAFISVYNSSCFYNSTVWYTTWHTPVGFTSRWAVPWHTEAASAGYSSPASARHPGWRWWLGPCSCCCLQMINQP